MVAVPPGGFQLLRGSLKTFDKTADSGRVRVLSFCPDCGTRIHATAKGDPEGFTGLRLGTVDQRAELRPVAQVFCRSALGWVQDLGGVRAYPGGRPG